MTPQTISILAAVRAIGGAVRECEAPAALLGGAIGTARLTIRDQAHAYIAGPCDQCGRRSVATGRQHDRAVVRSDLKEWPQSGSGHCHVSQAVPL